MFREKVIAGFAEPVDRRRTSGARALFAALDPRFDPSVAMQLQQLLTDRFAGEAERVGELRDRRGTAALQRRQDGAPAVG